MTEVVHRSSVGWALQYKQHKNRREQCIQPHGNPGECARKRIDLERAGGADAVGSETGGEALSRGVPPSGRYGKSGTPAAAWGVGATGLKELWQSGHGSRPELTIRPDLTDKTLTAVSENPCM
jgi:hypothetical protein